jgi:hypothetical protein
MTPSTSATMTMTVPRSGWSSTSASGTAASASACTTSTWPGVSVPSRFSARIIDMPTTSATLANSDGWIAKPAGSTIHECAPRIVEPSGVSTATSPAMESR